MTHKAKNTYRKHRKWTWFAVLGVLVLAALAAVPAFAIDTGGNDGSGNDNAIPSSMSLKQVYSSLVNVGGSNFACSAAGNLGYGAGQGDASVLQSQISKPQKGLKWNPSPGVTLEITEPVSKETFGFKITGGKVLHVGVNGGTNTSWYDYTKNGYEYGVDGDSGLRATPKSGTTATATTPATTTAWYVTSITTFCYVPNSWVKPTCTTPFGPNPGATSADVEYSAQLQPKEAPAPPCKEQRVVMETGPGYANLHPIPGGTGDWAVVERIAWPVSGTSPTVEIRYNDIEPYNDTNLRVMPLCGSDPRADDASYLLPPGVTPVLPADDKGPHTSCILKLTVSAGSTESPPKSPRKHVAWIFSTVDGYRNLG